MERIYLSREEREALKEIDRAAVDELVEQALRDRCVSSKGLRLDRCGVYVGAKLRAFERTLRDLASAKSAKKYSEIEYWARRAGSDLQFSIDRMKERVEVEEKEMQLFQIDDHVLTPVRLSENLSVYVSYRWRSTINDEWKFGSITFAHDVEIRIDYTIPAPKRKPSTRKQQEDRQEILYREWEHLVQLSLHAVRDFFRQGGDAETIPKTFRVRVDSYGGGLNNFSAQFWPP
ncbi:hypothetical protein DFR29_109158 [Tahibacter aquaticus]|uniref:Uncharacterized protein n=1 Tax=Tahibacter aquaticus TaxID=520092 RepID=A0A4R6YUS3_9GAMM|nr:hypothetical protein [Tahibacter aquaticus]TDR42102.1 hypothetical protein DFR29_109158 [Tahibacter aquaticus]